MRRTSALILLLGVYAAGCKYMPHGYSAHDPAQPDQLEAAARAAAFNDTGCTAEQVVVRSIDGHTAETTGCGVQTTYTCWRGTNARDNERRDKRNRTRECEPAPGVSVDAGQDGKGDGGP